MLKKTYFHEFIQKNAEQGNLVVQPRMGFSQINQMREGLMAVKSVEAPTVGTITIDSFTRTGNFERAKQAIIEEKVLNGYPIVSYSDTQNQELISGIRSHDFPVQVRHGSSKPQRIFQSTIAATIDAIEGGPISYCFPYGRTPLTESIEAWQHSCQIFHQSCNELFHIESFGGCMMGQLSPPSMLIAITMIEALFFIENGIKSFSVSLAQGTNTNQDIAALRVLRRLGNKYFNTPNWHIVFYTFMGKFPQTYEGAKHIIETSARIAKFGGAERLIVKTVKEAHQIPSIQDNQEALKWSFEASKNLKDLFWSSTEIKNFEEQIYQEADFLIEIALNSNRNIAESIQTVFSKGYWDVPYCLHPDNKRLTSTKIDKLGTVSWANTGKIPFPRYLTEGNYQERELTSTQLLKMLSFNQHKYDSISMSKYIMN